LQFDVVDLLTQAAHTLGRIDSGADRQCMHPVEHQLHPRRVDAGVGLPEAADDADDLARLGSKAVDLAVSLAVPFQPAVPFHPCAAFDPYGFRVVGVDRVAGVALPHRCHHTRGLRMELADADGRLVLLVDRDDRRQDDRCPGLAEQAPDRVIHRLLGFQ
jgi:hypothetical protein